MSPDIAARARRGEPIDIQYSPSDPEILRLPPRLHETLEASIRVFVFGLCGIAGLVFLVALVTRLRK